MVYGIMEADRFMVIDTEWLEDEFPSLGMFASDVVRNTMGNAVYGTIVDISQATGRANPPTNDYKTEVEHLYDILYRHCSLEEWDPPSLGYFMVISGDYEKDHNEYIPRLN